MFNKKTIIHFEALAIGWLLIIMVATAVLAAFGNYGLLVALFEVVSAITNSGFSIVEDPSKLEQIIKVGLMLFGKANVIAVLLHIGHNVHKRNGNGKH